jgi:hypothetical protein
MDVISMLQVAAGLFAIAAAGGLVMAAIRLLGARNPPAWLSMLHGLLAAAGVTLVAYAAALGGVPTPGGWALLLFVVAAAGGAAMNLLWQWRQRPLPVGLMIGHAALAVAGFLLLCIAAF